MFCNEVFDRLGISPFLCERDAVCDGPDGLNELGRCVAPPQDLLGLGLDVFSFLKVLSVADVVCDHGGKKCYRIEWRVGVCLDLRLVDPKGNGDNSLDVFPVVRDVVLAHGVL